jgi:hypothetical protein
VFRHYTGRRRKTTKPKRNRPIARNLSSINHTVVGGGIDAVAGEGRDAWFFPASHGSNDYPDLKCEDNEMSLRYIAMFLWGFVLILVAAASLVGFIIDAGQYLDAEGKFSPDAPAFMPGIYFALRDNGSLLPA